MARATADWGARLGRYIPIEELGRGGMGRVLRAYDPQLQREVALKLLHDELDEGHTTRLLREAQALAKLSHPNVVQVYEADRVGDQTFIAMELVEGRTLQAWMRQEPRPDWRSCVELFVQLGAGLAAAHERGLVHRDFKPGNAIIDGKGRPRVLDFGLARKLDAEADDEPSRGPRAASDDEPTLDAPLTRTGAVVGTPAYMPPEQMKGAEVDARSDQFSFCVALYEAVYGERPFEGDSMMAMVVSMQGGSVRLAPKGSTVPTALRKLLLRGLARAPAERWPSMEALLAELRALAAPRRWRWLAPSVAMGLLAIGAGLGVQQYAAWASRCTGARAQLDGIWDDARRQQLETAILGTELVYAPATWQRVQERLDGYADAWAGRHTEICLATRVTEEQTEEEMALRMGCLREHRTALRAVVDVLARADEEAVWKAVELVAGLPMLARCDDLELLAQQHQRVPPPEDPRVQAEVEALRERLADIEAEQEAGKYARALEQVEPVVRQAEALEHVPLVAEAKLRRGSLLVDSSRVAEGEQGLQEAYALALQHEHFDVALAAAQRLTSLVGVQRARPAEGLVWGATALPLAERSGNAVERAMSANNLGGVFVTQGEYEQAELHYRRALEIRETILGPYDPRVGQSANNLGFVLAHQAEYEQAERYYERALSTFEQALGPEHPYVASSLNNLGGVLARRGEYEQAERHQRRALEIREKALGPEHAHVASSLADLGNLLLAKEEHEQAELHYRRALTVFENALGPDHPDVAGIVLNLGLVLEAQGKYEQAELYARRAVLMLEQTLGPHHPQVADASYILGNVAFAQGEHEEAALHYQRALEIREQALGADHPELARPLVGLAMIALAQDRLDAARAAAEQALSIREAAEVAPEDLAEARFVLARALWPDEPERPRARELAEQARDALAMCGKLCERGLAEVEAWLVEHPRP
jgi:eukaryotic-like serine/threonine-protein kinase